MQKTLILVLVAVLSIQVQANSSDGIDEAKFIEDSKCLGKEKLTMAEVSEFALQDKMEAAEKNPKLKCFAACVLEYGKLLDGCSVIYNIKTDEVSGDKKEEFAKIMEKCKDAVKGTDRCECGYQLIKCINAKDKKA